MKFMMFVVSDPQPDSEQDQSDIDLWVDPLDASGKRVIGEVLAPPSDSTVVRVRGGKVLTTPKNSGDPPPAPRELATGLVEPAGIAVDDTGVYFADHGAGTLMVVPK